MLRLSFETDNDAFSDNELHEVANTLNRIAAKIRSGETEGIIWDLNGNKVGKYKLLPEQLKGGYL